MIKLFSLEVEVGNLLCQIINFFPLLKYEMHVYVGVNVFAKLWIYIFYIRTFIYFNGQFIHSLYSTLSQK